MQLFFLQPSFYAKAQVKQDVSKVIHHFYDATKQAFVCISNDSSYSIYHEASATYETKKLKFLTDSSFTHFVTEYIPVSTSNKGTFFIHNACGVVYHFIGDSIYRHDQSFYHKNQIGGVIFEQNNEIFMYGGYGMFTEKNILVHYNQFMREWINVEYANDGPKELTIPILVQGKNKLYHLGGINRQGVFLIEQASCLDISTKSWSILGELTSNFATNVIRNIGRSQSKTKLELIALEDRIVLIDVNKNEFHVRAMNPIGAIKSIKAHPFNAELVQVHFERTGVSSYFIQVMSIHDLLGENIASGKIWEDPPKTSWFTQYWKEFFTFLIGMLLMWVILFLNNYRKAKRTAHSRIDFTKIDLQDLQFIALQKLFLTAPEHTVEVSAINPIVEEEGITPDTIKKRRERLIKEFSTAVAIQTGLAPTEIFLEMRHPKDKRIKLLKLSNKLITNE